eukprot:222582-Chlamydomonas_euryale.AAC.9
MGRQLSTASLQRHDCSGSGPKRRGHGCGVCWPARSRCRARAPLGLVARLTAAGRRAEEGAAVSRGARPGCPVGGSYLAREGVAPHRRGGFTPSVRSPVAAQGVSVAPVALLSGGTCEHAAIVPVRKGCMPTGAMDPARMASVAAVEVVSSEYASVPNCKPINGNALLSAAPDGLDGISCCRADRGLLNGAGGTARVSDECPLPGRRCPLMSIQGVLTCWGRWVAAHALQHAMCYGQQHFMQAA